MPVPISSILALPRFQKLDKFEAPTSIPSELLEFLDQGFLGSDLLPGEQAKEMFLDMERKEFNKIMEILQKMNLQEFTLRQIPPGADEELLVMVLSKSRTVRLTKNLPDTLMTKFFESIPRSLLKRLCVRHLNIKTIDPKSVAVALNSLEEFQCFIQQNFFTEQQARAFYREMLKGTTKLKVLKLSSTIWSEIMDLEPE